MSDYDDGSSLESDFANKRMCAPEVSYMVEFLDAAMDMIGKEGGAHFLDCGIIGHGGWFDKAENAKDIYNIGMKGKPITLKDVRTVFRVSEFMYSERSYCFERFHVSKDGKPIRMIWGS